MQLTDAIALIRGVFATQQEKATWADLGCGTGLFTHALARLLAPESSVYAIDKSNVRLTEFSSPGHVSICQLRLDFTNATGGLSGLDGVLMANALHYVRDKLPVIQQWQKSLKPGAPFIIVEYDTDRANPWVPFPVRFAALKNLFVAAGYTTITKIGSMPSRYRNGDLYAALITP